MRLILPGCTAVIALAALTSMSATDLPATGVIHADQPWGTWYDPETGREPGFL